MGTESPLPSNGAQTIFYIGQHETTQSEPVNFELLSQSLALGYDFVTTPITTSAFHSRVLSQVRDYQENVSNQDQTKNVPLTTISPLTPADTTLEPQPSNNALIGIVSPWIDLGSPDLLIARISRQILNIEVAYAAFCGISNVIVYGPTFSAQSMQFSRDIREALGMGPYLHIHILLPMTGELEINHGDLTHLSEICPEAHLEENSSLHESDERDIYGSWNVWNMVRTVCSYSQKLSIALEVPRQLPSLSLQSRWYAEPTRLLVFPRTSFLRNAKGYPVVSKPHQSLVSRFARLRFPPWILLSDVASLRISSTSNGNGQPADPTPAEAASLNGGEKLKDPAPHLRYFRHLQQNQPALPPIEEFGHGYQDYLQSPLQPLTDNLESITYEVFEKDPVKYEWYGRAIAAALKDLASIIEDEPRELVIAVVGAGRGPLVTRALQASKQTGIAIQCWAVEKNPNAFVLLQRRNISDPLWNNQVQIVKSDMRHWQGPTTTSGSHQKIDILISELLGSFGDNELSPECLDGAQHLLHRDHGINIPQSYSAHLTPISSPRLHGDLLGRTGADKWELPYVVMLHQYDYLSIHPGESDTSRTADVKQAWSFSHPSPADILEQVRSRAGGSSDSGGWAGGDGTNEHNSRSCKVVFDCREPGVCHGLAGYFETVLYEGSTEKIELSTNPLTMEAKSKDMISWFPIFFPLRTPLHIPDNSNMEVSMWRQTDDRSVWYEWIVEVYEGTDGKRRRQLGMSELHSSRKHGCLV